MDQSSAINDIQLKRKHLEHQKSIDFDNSEFNSFCTTLGIDTLYENNLEKEEEFEKKTTLINILDSIAEEIETESPKDEKRNEYISEIDIIRRAMDGPVLNYGFSGPKF
jgi:hypothetical protein